MVSWNHAPSDSFYNPKDFTMLRFGSVLAIIAFIFAVAALGSSYVVLVGAAIVAAIAFAFAFKFFRADKLELQKTQNRASDIATVVMGRAKTRDDWMPDARVLGGMTFNRKEGRIEITGKLSDDTIDRVFR
jgi:hypothetical protein